MFSVKFVIEKKENKQKEAELDPFKKNFYSISIWFYLFELFQHDFDFKSAPAFYSINPLINSTAVIYHSWSIQISILCFVLRIKVTK